MNEIMKQREAGYKAANKIDEEINKLMDNYSITEYPWMWLTIVRTVSTGLSLVEKIAEKVLEDA